MKSAFNVGDLVEIIVDIRLFNLNIDAGAVGFIKEKHPDNIYTIFLSTGREEKFLKHYLRAKK